MNIFITGGTSGIGKSIVELLSLSGHNVVFVGRDAKRGADVEQISGGTFIRADLSNMQECARAVDEYFQLYDTCDVLINNAGLWTEGKLEAADPKEIEKVIEINTLSPIIITQYMVSKIRSLQNSEKQENAKILFINSIAGLNAKAERSVYNASKWAITGFARSLNLELGKEKISVTNICPGYVQTELFDHAGYSREIHGAMEPSNVAEAVQYIINLPNDVNIGEISIKPTSYV